MNESPTGSDVAENLRMSLSAPQPNPDKLIQINNLLLNDTAPAITYPSHEDDPDYRFFPTGGHHFLINRRGAVLLGDLAR